MRGNASIKKPMIQVSRPWTEEHDSGSWARFKCLTCYNTFALYETEAATWSFCPRCGARVTIQRRDIPPKKYHDDFGFHVQAGGVWTLVRAPQFTIRLMEKFPDDEPFIEKERVTGAHCLIKRRFLWWAKSPYQIGSKLIELVRSDPLPLP